MSFLHTLTIKSFHKYNPDWQIRVYNFKVPFEPSLAPKYKHYTGEDYFRQVRTWDYVEIHDVDLWDQNFHSILISDIWRRGILYENGGLYSDFDVIWLKPVEHLMNVEHVGEWDKFTSLVSYYNFTEGFHNVSILMSTRGNDFDGKIIEAQREVISYSYDDQAFGTSLLNIMYPKYEDIDIDGIVGIKYETFYPYSTFNLAQLFINNDLSPIENNNTVAIHWFNGNPLSKMFINNSLYDNECSMNTIIKNEGYVAS